MSEKEKIELIDEYQNIDVISNLFFDGKDDITLTDLEYMCRTNRNLNGSCAYCPMGNGKHCFYALIKKQFRGANSFRNSVLHWLSENPPTSYLMDVKIKMNGIPLDETYHIPKICVRNLYKDPEAPVCSCGNISCFDVSKKECRECWRKPMDKLLQEEDKDAKKDEEIIDIEYDEV